MKDCNKMDWNEVYNIVEILAPNKKFETGDEARNYCNTIVNDLKKEFKESKVKDFEEYANEWAENSNPIYYNNIASWYCKNINRFDLVDDYIEEVNGNEKFSVLDLMQKTQKHLLEGFASNVLED